MNISGIVPISNFLEHEFTPKSEPPRKFACYKCGKAYINLNGLQYHIRNHPNCESEPRKRHRRTDPPASISPPLAKFSIMNPPKSGLPDVKYSESESESEPGNVMENSNIIVLSDV